MTGTPPTAGAASPRESGPGPFRPAISFEPAPLTAVIAPRMSVAGARAAGIVLRLDAAYAEETFEIDIVDETGAPALSIGRFSEDEVVATWRGLGASSGLPLMIERADGSLHCPYPQIGRLQLGAIHIRKRHGLLNRRPRFLVRRKTGRLPVCPTVHREAELARGEDA
jgi:hypothetical protein